LLSLLGSPPVAAAASVAEDVRRAGPLALGGGGREGEKVEEVEVELPTTPMSRSEHRRLVKAKTAAPRCAGNAVATAGLSWLQHRARAESVRPDRKPLDARIVLEIRKGRVDWFGRKSFCSPSPSSPKSDSTFFLALSPSHDRERGAPCFPFVCSRL